MSTTYSADRTFLVNPETALATILAGNGRATSHTVTTLSELDDIVQRAEAALDRLHLPQALRTGARFTHIGAGPGANAYKFSATVSKIVLQRRKAGWEITYAGTAKAYPKAPVREALHISTKVRAEAEKRVLAAAFAGVVVEDGAATKAA